MEGFPWCLHKNDENEWEITRICDQTRVYLRDCGGIRTEERLKPW